MRKALILILLVLLCFSNVYAKNNAFKVSGVPYALQISSCLDSGQGSVHSKYGFGAEAKYQRVIGRGFFFEAGAGFDLFFMPDNKPVFSNILPFAGIGYGDYITKKVALNFHIDGGADFLVYKGEISPTITLKTGVGASYRIRENLDLTIGAEGSFGFAKKSGTRYVNYRVYPVVGLSYEF